MVFFFLGFLFDFFGQEPHSMVCRSHVDSLFPHYTHNKHTHVCTHRYDHRLSFSFTYVKLNFEQVEEKGN